MLAERDVTAPQLEKARGVDDAVEAARRRFHEAESVGFDHNRLERPEKLIRRRLRNAYGHFPEAAYEPLRELLLINEMDLAIAAGIELDLMPDRELRSRVLHGLEVRMGEIFQILEALRFDPLTATLFPPVWLDGETAFWYSRGAIAPVPSPVENGSARQKRLPAGRPSALRNKTTPRGSPERPRLDGKPERASTSARGLRRALNRHLVGLGKGQELFRDVEAVREAIAEYHRAVEALGDDGDPVAWFEEHPAETGSRPFHGRRRWHGSRLYREIILDDPVDLPLGRSVENVAIARASRPERTNCSECRRKFSEIETRGQSPSRAWCRSCEAERRKKHREQKRRELARLEGRA